MRTIQQATTHPAATLSVSCILFQAVLASDSIYGSQKDPPLPLTCRGKQILKNDNQEDKNEWKNKQEFLVQSETAGVNLEPCGPGGSVWASQGGREHLTHPSD